MTPVDPWDDSLPYEPFMGRWSKRIAPLFLDWLDQPAGLRWLDVGCGTGALTENIVRRAGPRAVLAIDPSEVFITRAAGMVEPGQNVAFRVAVAQTIPAADESFDAAVSALALNFFPDPVAGLREMRRVVRPGGLIAAYVWDYAEGMEMLRVFWDTAVALDPAAPALDEGARFPLCRPDALREAFAAAGLAAEVRALDAPTVFADFDDYWTPFLGGVGPAPGYVASLSEERRQALAAALRAALPIRPDGAIALSARAWGVRAHV